MWRPAVAIPVNDFFLGISVECYTNTDDNNKQNPAQLIEGAGISLKNRRIIMEKTKDITLAGQNRLATENLGKLIFAYSLPSIISMLVNAVYNIVDQIYIGWGVGELGMAATNVTFPLTTIAMAVALLFGTGGAASISLSLGKGKRDEADGIAGNSLSALVISGIVITAVSLIGLEPMLRAFGATESVMPYALSYGIFIVLGIPFLIFSAGAAQIIRADGSPTYAMISMISGAIFNIIFDPIFLFVFDMGIQGVALATFLSQVLTSVLAVAYFVKRAKNISIKKQSLRLQSAIIKSISALGAAACFNQLAMTLVQIVMNNILIYYGALSVYGSEIPLAVAGAISKVNMMFMVVILGIAQGCQPIVGFNYGAGNYGRVKKTYKIAAVSVTIYSVIAFACFQLFPNQIMSIFGTGNELYYEFAESYMRIFMMLIFLVGLQAYTSNFFTAIGKPILGLLMSMTRQVLILTPLLIILPRFFGLEGILYAGPVADGVATLLAMIFIAREMKKMTAMEGHADGKMVRLPDAAVSVETA